MPYGIRFKPLCHTPYRFDCTAITERLPVNIVKCNKSSGAPNYAPTVTESAIDCANLYALNRLNIDARDSLYLTAKALADTPLALSSLINRFLSANLASLNLGT